MITFKLVQFLLSNLLVSDTRGKQHKRKEHSVTAAGLFNFVLLLLVSLGTYFPPTKKSQFKQFVGFLSLEYMALQLLHSPVPLAVNFSLPDAISYEMEQKNSQLEVYLLYFNKNPLIQGLSVNFSVFFFLFSTICEVFLVCNC